MQAIFSIFFLIFQSFNASAYNDLFSCIPVTSIFTFSFLPYPKTSTSRILSSVSNTLWAPRVSFEIRHLRRLRLERSRESLSRSWWLAQSYPAHVAYGGKYPAGASPLGYLFFYLSLQIILPLDKSYGESSIVTLSPGKIRIKFILS